MSRLYTKEHEWIQVEGNIGTFGISSYAVEQLGDITFVELPKVGTEISQKEVICSVESVKAASDIYAPVSGKILEVNTELEDVPELMNESPEKNGWIAKIEISETEELDSLMDQGKYQAFLKELD